MQVMDQCDPDFGPFSHHPDCAHGWQSEATRQHCILPVSGRKGEGGGVLSLSLAVAVASLSGTI